MCTPEQKPKTGTFYIKSSPFWFHPNYSWGHQLNNHEYWITSPLPKGPLLFSPNQRFHPHSNLCCWKLFHSCLTKLTTPQHKKLLANKSFQDFWIWNCPETRTGLLELKGLSKTYSTRKRSYPKLVYSLIITPFSIFLCAPTFSLSFISLISHRSPFLFYFLL